VGGRNDAAAIRLMLRPHGLLAPLDQPTSTPRLRAAGHLYFRAFTPRGRPPSAPDMTTWAIGRLPGRDSHPLDRCCYGLHQKTGLSASAAGEAGAVESSSPAARCRPCSRLPAPATYCSAQTGRSYPRRPRSISPVVSTNTASTHRPAPRSTTRTRLGCSTERPPRHRRREARPRAHASPAYAKRQSRSNITAQGCGERSPGATRAAPTRPPPRGTPCG